MNDPLIEIDQNQYLQNQGSEVNGLVKFKTRWVFCFFLYFRGTWNCLMRIMVMRWLDVGFIPKQCQRIFALDGSFSGSTVFSNIYFIFH